MSVSKRWLSERSEDSALREQARSADLSARHLCYPLFISETASEPEPISSMPGIMRYPLGAAENEARRVLERDVPAVLLFGIPAHKDERGTAAHDADGIVQRAIKLIKDAYPELLVIADACLCQYTTHGHCGVLSDDGSIDNERTLAALGEIALSYARAGADVVAPSSMTPGRVAAIRQALDGEGFDEVPILSYAAKFASSFYGPFREAADSAPAFGDRRAYQLEVADIERAVREAETDISEGAAMVMVKPALPYLDVVHAVRQATSVPVAAYNVSGEYAMIKTAAAAGYIDERAAVLEALLGIRRAGADLIVTYHAKEAAKWLRG